LKRTRLADFIIDKTMLQIGSDYAWLWVAIEPVHKQVLGLHVSRHRNILVAEYFLISLIEVYGKGILYIQMADHGILKHVLLYWSENIYFIFTFREKSITERSIEYFKYRTENLDDYYPCKKLHTM
jgi:putative transposase